MPTLGIILVFAFALAACGGGGSSNSGSSTEGGASSGGGTGTPAPTLAVANLQLAQTHVIPPQGKTITGSDGENLELNMVGQRAALALFEITPANVSGVQVEGRSGTLSFGSVPLQSNNALPATESAGPRFSEKTQWWPKYRRNGCSPVWNYG